jgi:3-phenylpropionate/trans-cinnamate dioxygenase ferredoxin subunit
VKVTHELFALDELEADGCMIEGGAHGARFNLKTGEPESLPATQPVPVYEVAVSDGIVVLTLADDEEKDQ